MLFLISNTQQWLDNVRRAIIYQVPFCGKKNLLQKTYFLTSISLAHILENHYYKILRHPEKSEFTIDVAEILSYMKEAHEKNPRPIFGSLNFKRVFEAKECIGVDKNGISSAPIAFITDNSGKIITAFPSILTK